MLSDPTPGGLHVLDKDEFIVGRAPEVDLSIDDPGLSRAHARFIRHGNSYFVEDLKSTNGTSVNGERICGLTLLQAGERIQLGRDIVLRFAIQDRLALEAAERVYEQSIRDALTGLHNRRYLEEQLAHKYTCAVRDHTDMAVVIFDVDHFKRINDAFGHQAGDATLQMLGQLLQRHANTSDVIARYGGEEFVLLSAGQTIVEAKQRAETIRQTLASSEQRAEGRSYHATLSAGVASLRHGGYRTINALLSAADQALYRAKETGRNRVVIAQKTA